jgi:predicted O-linked N-acetylglucosamine transferase (SPINDLY family)
MNRKQRRAAGKPGQASSRARDTAVTELLRTGLKQHQAGRLAEAESCYRRLLAAQPDHADALYLRGVIAQQLGRADVSLELIGKAIQRNSRNPLYFVKRATVLEQVNRLDEALESYSRALAINPNLPEAANNCGVVLLKLKQIDKALASFDRALTLNPGFVEAFINRGIALQQLVRPDEALQSYERALGLRPDSPEALNYRGTALQDLRRLDEAVDNYDRALALKVDYVEAFYNRGVVLDWLGRLDEALVSYNRAVALRPNCVEGFFDRGVVLHKLKRFDEALASYDRALSLKTDYAEAFNNRGVVLEQLRRFEEALDSFGKALTLKPNYTEALNNRGVVLRQLRRYEEALESYDHALALQPDSALAFNGVIHCVNCLCDWDRRAALAGEATARITEMKAVIHPFTLLGWSGDPLLQLQCAKNFVADSFPSLPQPAWIGTKWRHDKVRIAYLSADFHKHATTSLMAELFERHDRTRFEVTAVSFGLDDHSDMRRRIIAAFDQFLDVGGVPDEAVARRLSDLQIDIAVDLKGYTQDARPGILAHRPAPIQVSYLGYPGTMAAGFFDYIIADKIVAPFEHQEFYTEKIVHLPNSYQVNDTKRTIGTSTPTRQEAGLPDSGLVFCCFNQSWKITPDVFNVWMRVLRAVDDSVLWLLGDHGRTMQNLRNSAKDHGIDLGRLVFASRVPNEDHLARHCLADLFLDTLPCNAHTTASDALWAGLPVVTQLGETFAGRVAASVLNALGLSELVTQTIEDYENLILQLAKTPTLLEKYRSRLIANRMTHPLFDIDRFRCNIEVAYFQMWEIWQRGEQPRSFAVPESPVPHNPTTS